MPRIAYLSADEGEFYRRLDRLMDISARSLKTKRTVITRLLDGGLSDPIPVKYFESIGYDRIVVVLTQPDSYVKDKPRILRLMKPMLRRYPEIYADMASRHIGYNETVRYIREKEKNGEMFVIRPKKSLNIGKTEHNPERLERVYNEGRREAEENIERVLEFLNAK